MTETQVTTSSRPREAGIALVLAIMALLLLTFLGLTLAATTSTELQIATNYRWSEQARYNAEAGLEAGKVILRNIPTTVSWATLLPTQRVGTRWNTTNGSATAAAGRSRGLDGQRRLGHRAAQLRELGLRQPRGQRGLRRGPERRRVHRSPRASCRTRPCIFGQRLNGAVTLWVRRGYDILNNMTAGNNIEDNASEIALILTSEGVAPFSDGSSSLAFATANQATHVYEVSLLRQADQTDPCETYRAQAGNGVSGSGFAVCGALRLDCTGGPTGQEADLLGGGSARPLATQGAPSAMAAAPSAPSARSRIPPTPASASSSR